MIRQHKKMILLTSIATLLPILIGLLLWKQLPDSVATHWSTGNEPDGYSSKAFAVFGLPVIMLILHLVCVIATNIDPKANSINKKIFFIVLWICPVFSIIVCSTVYGYNLGYQFDIGFLCGLLIGVLYLILGKHSNPDQHTTKCRSHIYQDIILSLTIHIYKYICIPICKRYFLKILPCIV